MKRLLDRNESLTNRVFLKKSKKDEGTYPTLLVSYWGSNDNPIENLNPYGMFAVPPDESHGISWSINGIEENQIGILYKADIRPIGLEPGDAAFGNFLNDTFSLWLNNGEINIKSKTGASLVMSGQDEEGAGGGEITVTDSAGSTLVMAEDGSIVTTAAGGGVIAMGEDGSIVATSGGDGVITMAADGTITATTNQFTIDAPLTIMTGNLQVAGNISGAGALAVSGSSTLTGSVAVEGDVAISGAAQLGSGGAAIARVGDPVVVNVSGGSSSGPASGTITAGSSNNTAN